MTKQIVNIGSSANDGTGDPDRTAYTKLQSNDDELYKVLSGSIVSGKFYAAAPYAVLNTGTAPVAANMYMMPIIISSTRTLTSILTYITTAQASQAFALAVYAHNYTTQQPTGTPIASTLFTLSTAATGGLEGALTANVQLNPGLYWFAFQSNATTAVWQAPAATSGVFSYIFGDATIASVVNGAQTVTCGLQTTNTFGSWPDLTTPPAYGFLQSNRFPAMYLKYASVP